MSTIVTHFLTGISKGEFVDALKGDPHLGPGVLTTLASDSDTGPIVRCTCTPRSYGDQVLDAVNGVMCELGRQ